MYARRAVKYLHAFPIRQSAARNSFICLGQRAVAHLANHGNRTVQIKMTWSKFAPSNCLSASATIPTALSEMIGLCQPSGYTFLGIPLAARSMAWDAGCLSRM